MALSDLQNVPDFVRESSSKDVKFNIGNGGISEVNAKINVSIDDVVVKESEVVARPQVLTEITINDVLVDLSDGNHTLKVEVVNDNEGIADNNVLTKDFTVVSKPAKFWNFEDGQLRQSSHSVPRMAVRLVLRQVMNSMKTVGDFSILLNMKCLVNICWPVHHG